MRIKKLELLGFKSFLEKTAFQFDVPITSIVGPNGCGKSNVVDALKWITGELSYKELRGKSMEDLIFAGSEKRPPTSMMEVLLTLDNESSLGPVQYKDFAEIVVQRKIFRDGSSEFYINKSACRLKDITDLFLDTGIGKSSYSIIEQGRVGAIVSSRPEDRRLIIEEASGITKFKARKKAALKKMEHTQQNLLRVNDIIKELTRQTASLKKQAEKAEKYKVLKEDVKQLDLKLLSYAWKKSELVLEELRSTHTRLKDSLSAEESKLLSNESQYETEKLRLLEFEKKLERMQEKVFEQKTTIQNLENEASNQQLKQSQLLETAQEEKERAAILLQKYEDLDLQHVNVSNSIKQSTLELEEIADNLNTDIEKESQLKSTLLNLEQALSELKTKNMQHLTREAEIKNNKQSLEEQNRSLDVKLQDINERVNETQEEVNQLSSSLSEKEEAFEQSNQMVLEFEESKISAEDELEHLNLDKEKCHQELIQINNEIERDASRLNTLQEFIDSYQGYEKGVQSIMKEKDSGNVGRVQGILGDMLEVEPGYEKAAYAALNEFVQCIVVEDSDDVVKTIDYLKSDAGEGRSSFLIEKDEAFHLTRKTDQKTANQNSIIKHVKAKGTFNKLIEQVLSTIYLVPSLSDALDLWKKGTQETMVTLEGDRISRNGIITGGKNEEQQGVLEIHNQVNELKERVEEKRQRSDKLSYELEKIQERILSLKAQIEGLSEDIKSHSQQKTSHEKELLSLGETQKYKNSFLQELFNQKQSYLNDIEQNKVALESMQIEYETLLEHKNNFLSKEEAFTQEITEMRASYEVHNQRLTEIKIKKASLDERQDALKKELESLDQQKSLAKEEAETLKLKSNERIEQAQEISHNVISLKEKRENILQEFTESETHLNVVKIEHDTLAEKLRTDEEQLKGYRSAKEHVVAQINKIQMDIQEEDYKLERLLEQVTERYELNLHDCIDQYYEDLEESTLGQSNQELQKLRNSLNAMGHVNLGALEELAELEERFSFLSEQKADLENTLNDLNTAIEHIDESTQEMFLDTYKKVNGRFQELFPKLFGGGKAKLVMTSDENILETGIDIVAQPPGKKLQNMNLMSGGEKALTAIALIFSIFDFKAPPFCILDEVDAPLDDANVGRFLGMVKEMSQKTQFIVITHNKATMEIAQNLYGVTMEEPGVSRTVSVQLNQGVEQLETNETQQASSVA
ncbi:MAG TPA: chromosome segregation protein SMC [Oligoflexia bacterium]|nr:chromosome segregation protein SMC [Oligoflexia bacterium]HMR23910.1 chromosome segregation protein SMC [Oligoflexia bacterium]